MRTTTKLSLIIATMLFAFNATSQDLPLTKQAAGLMQSKDIMAAKESIDAAVQTNENTSPYTWYIHSYVYKELYKAKDQGTKSIDNRELAIQSGLMSMELDKEEKYKSEVLKSLKYLASTYQNDAIDYAESSNQQDIEKAFYYFDLFVKTQRINNAQTDFDSMKKDLLKQMAQSYQNLYFKDKSKSDHLNSANAKYIEALSIDAKDYESNYNLAINYYNKGVQRISSIDHLTPIQELMLIQEDCVDLFKKSLPYMLEAHTQTDERKEPIKGLMAIYLALSEEVKSEEFKTKLEAVKENK